MYVCVYSLVFDEAVIGTAGGAVGAPDPPGRRKKY